jgi:3'-5' exoribonuclease
MRYWYNMKSTFVSDLVPGNAVDELFALRKVELKEYPNGKMIVLEVGDQTGRIKGVIWSGLSELYKKLVPGEVFRIKGTVTTYKGETQLTIEMIEAEKDYDVRDFLPVGPFTAEELEMKLSSAMEGISDIDYRALVSMVFADKKFRSGFLSGVGGKLWHHNYVGGLAEHTLGVHDLCRDFAARYKELDADLMAAGALLHDIGKVESYSLENFIDYTDAGRLIGHIVIGDEIVKSAISRLPEFPAEKNLKIRHLILSHQGSPEQSSPVSPMMPEGMALYLADLLDSKLAAFRRITRKEKREGVRWSSYVNLLDRYIFFGEDEIDAQKDI